MRLESISVRNFGRHEATTLDLSGTTLAAITGENGAGKSTFFVEAVLWALKKRCRTAPDKIMKEGATDMSVCIVLLLNGKMYRCERTLSTRTKKGSSSLSFTIQSGNGWEPVGSDPQQAIDALIPDYELLIQTCFAVQGKLDEFTRARPGERRAALAKILADHYVGLKKIANEHVLTLDREIQAIEAQLTAAAEDADKIEGIRLDLKDNEDEKISVVADIAGYEAEIHRINAHKAEAQMVVGSIDADKSRLSALTQRRESLGIRIAGLTTKHAELDELILDEPSLRDRVQRGNEASSLAEASIKDYNEKKLEIQSTIGNVDELRDRVARAQEKHMALGQRHVAIEQAKRVTHTFILTGPALREQIKRERNIQEQKDKCDVAILQCGATLETLAARIANTKESQREIDCLDQEIKDGQGIIAAEITAYNDETNRLRDNQQRDKENMDCLATVPCDSSLQGRCLFTAKAAEARARYDKHRDEIDARPTAVSDVLTAVSAIKADLFGNLNALRKKREGVAGAARYLDVTINGLTAGYASTTNDRTRLQKAVSGYLSQLSDCGNAATHLLKVERAEEDIEGITSELTGVVSEIDAVATEITSAGERMQQADIAQAAITRLTTDIANCEYGLIGTREANVVLAVQLVLAGQAKADIIEVAHELGLAQDEMTGIENDIQGAKECVQQADAARIELQGLVTSLDSVTPALERAREALSRIDTQHGLIGEQQARSQDAVTRRVTMAIQRRRMGQNSDEYAILVDAYTAIPILIIEASIPILEHEANVVLDRIADDGMQIRIDTQRDLKSRDGMAETLDIVVTTYEREGVWESFSGGEKMRVDLAIRIGLAKLLSHRAGAALELLVLDESTHAVDEKSVPEICRCLERLSQNIQIFMISHRPHEIETLPVQIHFSKHANGSTVEVTS